MIKFYRANANKKFEENGIVNDSNAWGIEHKNSRCILGLLINLIGVSCRTVDLVEALPRVSFDRGGNRAN